MGLIRSQDVFSPIVPAESQRTLGDVSTPFKLATTAWLLSLIPTLLALINYWIPELRRLPGRTFVIQQTAPLTSPILTEQRFDVTGLHPGPLGVLPALILLGTLVVWMAVQAKSAAIRLITAGLAMIVALLCLTQAVWWVAVNGVAVSATGLIMLLVAGATVATGAVGSIGIPKNRVPDKAAGNVGLLAIFGISLFVPVAIGRAFFPAGRVLGAVTDHSVASSQPITQVLKVSMQSGPWWGAWAGGLAAVGAAWAVWLILPRWDGRSPVKPIVGLVVAVAAISICIPAANRATGRYATATVVPTATLPDACGGGPLTVPGTQWAVTGSNCRRISSLQKMRTTDTRLLPVSLGPFALAYPEGGAIAAHFEAARYSDIIVAAATSRPGDRTPNMVIGLNAGSLEIAWTYACPANTLRLRLAKAADGDQVTRGAKTRPRETPSAVTKCGTGPTTRLSVVTGKAIR